MSQHTPAEAEAVREYFAQSAMTNIHMNDIPIFLFVNMDETAIYFGTPQITTVNVRGAKQFQSDVEAVAVKDARFASLLLLMQLNCLICYFKDLTEWQHCKEFASNSSIWQAWMRTGERLEGQSGHKHLERKSLVSLHTGQFEIYTVVRCNGKSQTQ